MSREVEKKVAELVRLNTISQFKWLNGSPKFFVTGHNNHKGPHWFAVLELFQWIAENAVGSYGLIYFCDDEATDNLHDRFQVLVLRRGKLIPATDGFLSPIDPKIEGEHSDI